jgi:hypothetical protein
MPEWTFDPIHKASQQRLPEIKVKASSLTEAYQIANSELNIVRGVNSQEYGFVTTNYTVDGNPVPLPVE